VPLQLALALSVALLLNRIRVAGRLFPRRLLRALRHLRGGGGLCVELALRAAGGLINQLLKALGLPMQQFLRNPDLALPSITVVAVWRSIGFAIIIFLAGLQQIPDIYYEAAQIDGANRWQMFWRITLPLLNPVIVYLAVLQTIEFLRMFDLVQNMTQGGPLNRTTTVVLEVYNEGFSSYNMGYAAALTVILFGVILADHGRSVAGPLAPRGVLTMATSVRF
jgi:multiple sugar transport system permease protein